MSHATDIADQVVTLINGRGFSHAPSSSSSSGSSSGTGATITAVRRWVPAADLQDLGTLLAVVVPGEETIEQAARGRTLRTCAVNLSVQKRVSVNVAGGGRIPDLTTAEVDELHKLLEEIVDYLMLTPLASPAVRPISAKLAGMAEKSLEGAHLVTDAASVTYEVNG